MADKSLKSRNDTIAVARQSLHRRATASLFEQGEEYMKPMVLARLVPSSDARIHYIPRDHAAFAQPARVF